MTPLDTILDVNGLSVAFDMGSAVNRALTDFSLSVPRGSVVGVVGESGSGKSVAARAIMQLVSRPGRITGGTALLKARKLDGRAVDLLACRADSAQMRRVRGSIVSLVFQEPMSALSMVHTIGEHMYRPVTLHLGLTGDANRQHCIRILENVRIPNAHERIDSYPFQLSGGLRQRAMIGISLCCNPELLIADEPTTALDVTTQAQILDLLRAIRRERDMSVIFITHDLGVVAEICDRVVVMYLGEVVEHGTAEQIFEDPRHPYTQALLRSVPRLGLGRSQKLQPIRGSIPDPLSRPRGCAFHTRCDRMVSGICDAQPPPVRPVDGDRLTRCVHV